MQELNEKEKEILRKYKVGKEELRAASKDMVCSVMVWLGAAFLVFFASVLIEEVTCGVATLSVKEFFIAVLFAFLATWWLRKDVYIITDQELELIAERMSDEVYERAVEKWRKRHHGKWFLLDECSNAGVYCSVCAKKVYRKEYANQKVKSPYCPNCGAKMDKE